MHLVKVAFILIAAVSAAPNNLKPYSTESPDIQPDSSCARDLGHAVEAAEKAKRCSYNWIKRDTAGDVQPDSSCARDLDYAIEAAVKAKRCSYNWIK